MAHWKELTNKKQSKLECYLALNREYTVAEYLTNVTDPNLRKALIVYRLSEHSLAIEKGLRRQTLTIICVVCFYVLFGCDMSGHSMLHV